MHRIIFLFFLPVFFLWNFCFAMVESLSMMESLNISGNPGDMIITTAIAGSEPDSVVDSSSIYNLKVSGSTKVVGEIIEGNLPANTTLNLSLQAPPGAISSPKDLTTSNQDLVTSISSGKYNNLSITYTFSATLSAGIVNSIPLKIQLKLL